MEERRERIDTFLRKPYNTKRENTEIYSYCRAVDEVPYTCCTYCKATATATSSTKREKRKVQCYCSYSYGSHWTIHYSSHPTHYTDSDMTSVYQVIQVIRTNMIPSYRTINRITQLIVYGWNDSVVIIHVGTNGHGHYNIHIISSITIPIFFYYFIVNTNTIIYNNQQLQQEGKEIGKECY